MLMRTFDVRQPYEGNNPFKVPEGYFDTFASRMMWRIGRMERPEARQAWVQWIPWLGAACVAALCVVFTPMAYVEGTDESSIVRQETAASNFGYADQAYDYVLMANAEKMEMYAADY